MPASASSAVERRSASRLSAAVGTGAWRRTRSIALHSTSVPSGEPSGRRAIVAVGGSGVYSSTPARRSASLLAQTQWWSADCSATGRSATPASSHRASKRPPGDSAGSYGPPTTQSSSGCSAANRRTTSTTSGTDVQLRTCGPASSTPPHSGCACPSPKPGSRAPPSRSTTCRARGARSSASSSSATTWPSETAAARARGASGSPVITTPPRKTVSTVPPASPLATSGVEADHHVLDPRVLLEAVHREVLAVARVLEAAVRHLGDQWDVGVDPHAAEVQSPGHPHRATVVLRPDRGRQAVLHPVGPADRLVLVAEALHGDDRAEHLVADQLVALPQSGHDGRLVEVARRQVATHAVPARGHRRVLRRALQEA